jgi:hypothetical protein
MQHVSIRKIKRLMLFREIIAVYSDNYTKPTESWQNTEFLNADAGGVK